ncbi:helix-turn-helix domain-containing protein [Dechloromonas agitata]|uniref:helix-turn-helix domain-containing protein n=1 Tax=Dechloromonas agitata TaxID=73030 RepID=UPI00237E20E5|nr:helix-turn-helix domain-containing protein [Dechloromonas agitata]MDE1545954.1 helix-turn-helix domain-containing protein [Dechloromonas agitata]
MTDVLSIAVKAVQIYAETHPRPTQVNQSQAAEMLGLSYPTVRKLIHSGVLPLNYCGLIPIEAIDRARAERKAA